MNNKNLNLAIRIMILIGICIGFLEYMTKENIGVFLIGILLCAALSILEALLKNNNIFLIFNFLVGIFISLFEIRLGVLFLFQLILENIDKNRNYIVVDLLFVVIAFSGIYGEQIVLILFFGAVLTSLNYCINKYSKKIRGLEEDLDKRIKINHRFSKMLRDEEEFHSQKIYNAKLKERNELSRKVHDEVGHVIAGSLMRLEACKVVIQTDKEKGLYILDQVTENLRIGMDDIRNTIHVIAPNNEEIGLNNIKDILNEKFNDINIETSFIYDKKIGIIEMKQWNLFYNAVKELSTNTIKYSNCTKVVVRIEVFNKIVKFSFKDNGIGATRIIKGYGLNKIEESVVKAGGNLILDGINGFSAIIILGMKVG